MISLGQVSCYQMWKKCAKMIKLQNVSLQVVIMYSFDFMSKLVKMWHLLDFYFWVLRACKIQRCSVHITCIYCYFNYNCVNKDNAGFIWINLFLIVLPEFESFSFWEFKHSFDTKWMTKYLCNTSETCSTIWSATWSKFWLQWRSFS